MSRYHIIFTTPLFSKGALETPEIRSPSIRGQLHGWCRAIGGQYADEKAIFGGVHDGASASKVVIRVSNITGQVSELNTLPHKMGGPASPKMAFTPDTAFDLHVLTRLGGFINPTQKALFERTLEVWLLLGTLGLRSTRAAGSFVWQALDNDFACPATFEAYEARCRLLLQSAPMKFALLETQYLSAEDARRVVSDTLGGRDDTQGQNDLALLHHPLGKVLGGRKTSPLRFRIVSLRDKHRIAAVWDNRGRVTGNGPGDLEGIVRLLQDRKPALGNQLTKIL